MAAGVARGKLGALAAMLAKFPDCGKNVGSLDWIRSNRSCPGFAFGEFDQVMRDNSSWRGYRRTGDERGVNLWGKKKPGNCSYCGKSGHWEQDCRVKKMDERWSDENNSRSGMRRSGLSPD
ncbi:uncharacterized protein LOC112350706 [Selaginella moellendorffii]|uniref:uncharacterized protein LOC112350706 n=1 Tax=Selaginella moellendorffii TaxID=88036 RepID=UPI000D1C89CE|nr:uncharacterized protein LOC112350706 [Selaginella moellendorffii]|eukprot:XP_024543159.1 uncharacterized protein LOC112350706 [Selaginella moellendorffii]